jgi:aryl-alcohol dehydrogenase-like predicted oxidoreductase
MAAVTPPPPDLILGTALWGWTMPEQVCFQILDTYYAAGFRQIDTATNYPINKNPQDFRRAEKILTNWITTNNIQDLQVIIKVGSINNLGGPEHELTRSFLLMNMEDYRELWGSNLDTFMIHWDNRRDPGAIADTLEVLQQAQAVGLQPGLSGIRHPEVYAQVAKEYPLPLRIEIKHNLLQSSYPHYRNFHGKAGFLTYGMNAGGLKLEGAYRNDSSSVVRGIPAKALDEKRHQLQTVLATSATGIRPGIDQFYQLGLLYSYYHPHVTGMIIGPSRLEQLEMNLDFYRQLQTYDYRDVYQSLQPSG